MNRDKLKAQEASLKKQLEVSRADMILKYCLVFLLIIQAEFPFTNSTHEPAKCACWKGSITHNTEQLATQDWELLPR